MAKKEKDKLRLKRSDIWMFIAVVAVIGLLWVLSNSGDATKPIIIVGSILLAFASVSVLWMRVQWEKSYGAASGKVLVERVFANGGSEKIWREVDGNWLLEKEEITGVKKYFFKLISKSNQPEAAIEAMNLLLSDFCYDSQWPDWAPRMMQITCRKTVIVDGIVQPVSNRTGHDWLQNPEIIAGVVNSQSLKVSQQATQQLTEANSELAELRANKGISSRMSTVIIIWALAATIAAFMFANQVYQFIPAAGG